MAQNIFAAGMDAFNQSYGQAQQFRQDFGATQAGKRLAGGDRAGAMQALGASGNVDGVRVLQDDQIKADDRRSNLEKEAVAQRFKALVDVSEGLKSVPKGQRLGALQRAMPIFGKVGLDPSAFAGIQTEDQLSDENLSLFSGKVTAKYKEMFKTDEGIFGLTAGGQVDTLKKFAPKPFEMDPTKTYVVPDEGPGAPNPEAPISTAPRQAPPTDRLFGALVQQESGGRAGVVGPQTDYGRAEGMTQMLPATAQQMAQKLGVAWRPELMRGGSPEAAEYQMTLGKAYFDEGMQKYGGDPVKALMYYHGGPNERLWGPKTRAYAQQVIARVGGSQGQDAPLQGGDGGDTVQAPTGYRVIQPGRSQRIWEDLPGGGQRNTQTGESKNVPNPKPGKLSAQALAQQNEHLTALQLASAINTRLEKATRQIDTGALDLGLGKNIVARGQNAIGFNSNQSRNFASLRADLEKMRNDSLRLNKGVQTEGDAKRAWDELLANMNDPAQVKQRFKEIEAYNQQAIAFHQDMVTQIRDDSGMSPIDTSKFLAKPLTRQSPPAKSGWSIEPVR